MQKILSFLYKGTKKVGDTIIVYGQTALTHGLFYLNNIQYGSIETTGIPYVSVAWNATCRIGGGLRMHNGLHGNPIGRPQKCAFVVNRNATLVIGSNVGMSCTVINCQNNIVIEDYVTIGGGTCIYDSDFHALRPELRKSGKAGTATKPVKIEENAFIGAHTLILKGVTIGKNAVVGAGSVVTKSIPAGQIWAGNPAKFINLIP